MSDDATLDDHVTKEQDGSNIQLGPIELDIPQRWDVRELYKIFNVISGNNYSGEHLSEEDNGGRIFLTLKSVNKGGGFNWDSIKYYNGEVNEREIVEPGELLISNTDVTQNGDIVGYSIQVPEFKSDREIAASMDLSILRPKSDKINVSYAQYLLQTEFIHSRMRAFSAGSTVLHLNTDLVESLSLPVPPISEQRNISTVFHTVNQAIQKTEKIIELTERAKRGILQDTIFDVNSEESVGRRFGPKVFNIPEYWQRVRLQEVTDLITRGKQPTYADEGVPVINQECIYWDGFHFENIRYLDNEAAEGWKDKYFVSDGDVVINSTGRGTLGRAQTYTDDIERAVDSHVTIVRPDTQKMTAGYLRYFLESNRGQGLLYSMCVTGSTGQIELSKSKLQLLSIPLPPKEEQKEIVNTLKQFDSNIRIQQKYKEQLGIFKQGLMQDLLSGEVRTTNVNIDIPEEVVKYG